MLKIKNHDVVYKVLSCIFAVIFVLYVLIYRNLIDMVYLGIVSIYFLQYLIENKKK